MGSLDSLLMTGASAFTTENRLLDMVLPQSTAFDHVNAVAGKLEGSEYISECYSYRILFHCDSANLKLSDVIGLPIGITILQADGEKRAITGVIRKVKSLGSDGGWADYEVEVVPFFALMSETYGSRLIANKSVPEIIEMLLGSHTDGNTIASQSFKLDNQLTKTYGSRSTVFQYRETQKHFLIRLMREEGIGFYFTFSVDNGIPTHTMVLFDEGMNLEQSSAGNIRFHRDDGTEDADVVTELHSTREIQSSVVTLSSTEYKSVTRPMSSESTWITHGDSGDALIGTLEHYEPMGAYYGDSSDGNNLSRYAKLRQQAKDLKTKSFQIVSTVRNMEAAQWFTLDDHPELDASSTSTDRQFTVLEMHITARNNLSNEDKKNPAPVYQNTAVIVRRTIPIVAEWTAEYAKPTARGMLTATVVGPANEIVYTDSLGRVKIIFPFQRDTDGFTGFDDSNWVRVAYGTDSGVGAGPLNVPRIGQEVLVGFIDGDIDRLVILATLFNGNKTPTNFSDVSRLPADRALAGNKSTEHHGTGYSELVHDNTQQQISAYLNTSYAHTHLKIGWLGTERTQGKSQPLGEGFSLDTQAAGVVRAAQSLLLTTEQQKSGGGPQLSRQGIIQVLSAVLDLTNRLNDLATQVEAHPTETGKDNKLVNDDHQTGPQATDGHQTHLKEAVQNLDKGFNFDPKGTSAKGDQAGQQPVLMIGSPSGTAVTSQQNVTVASGTNIDAVSQRDVNLTAGRRLVANAVESLSLLVDGAKAKIKDTFKLTVSTGNLLVRALNGKLLLNAKSDVVISTSGKFIVNATEGIWLNGKGGMVQIGDDILLQNPGTQTQKAGSFNLSGPASGNVSADLPTGKLKDCSWKSKNAAAKGGASSPMN